MRLLVTGSEGSLARMVTPHLLEQNHEIVGVDNFARYASEDRARDYEFVQGDLSDTATVRGLMEGGRFDAVLHFAALVYGVVGFHEKPADIIAENGLTTMNLLKYGNGVIGKFVYLSSSMVYERATTWPHREEDTADVPIMSTSYGLSKYIGERVVQSYQEQYGLKSVIWRPFNVITPFETPEEEGFSHVFTDMIEKILGARQSPVDVLGDGEQVRCFTSIYDVADAIARFSLDPRAENGVFNLGNPEPVTVKQLCEAIVEIGRRRGILPADYELAFNHLPIYADDVRKRIPAVDKARDVLGWEARIKLRESLEGYIERRFGDG